jgi:TonB-linked SusC/RagA family outer membrane protein
MKKILLLSLLMMVIGTFQQAFSQDRTVTGTVTSAEDNSALPGVNITVKGASRGTTTGADGRYSLDGVGNDATLVFSFIGLVSQEIAVGNRTIVDIRMQADVRQLNEVVVTALGLEADRDKLGTASATVKGGALVQSGETSIITGLAAKTPGVIIQRTTGDPGASANIQIRGQSTITGNLQPLIVVDGIPIFNSSIGDAGIVIGTGEQSNQTDGVVQQSRLNDINPDDIASMEVLKGASAAALWGTRAANGVIVITTKKGRGANKMNISFRSSYSIDQINKSVPLQQKFGQGTNGFFQSGQPRSWGDRIADRTGGTDTYITDPAAAGYNGFVTFPDGTVRYAVANGNAANPHGGRNSKEVYDHSKEVFNNGYTRDNSLSFSGGDARSNYFVSIGNTYTKGIAVRNSDYDRTTFRANVESRLAPNFKSSISTGYTATSSNRVQQGSNISGIFLGGLRTPADWDNSRYVGGYTNKAGAFLLNRQVTFRNPLGAGNAGFDNPFWTIDNVKNTSKVGRFLGSLEFVYDPTKWLTIINRTGIDTYNDRRTAYFPIQASAFPTGSLTEEQISETQLDNNLFARVTKNFSDRFGSTLIVGLNLNQRKADQVGSSVSNIVNPFSPPQLSNSPSTARTPYNLQTVVRTAAVYGQLEVQALDMFFLNLTGRAESASTFGSAQSTFFYPSANLAWQFTKLDGLSDNSFLSFGKLRIAYGTVGIQPGPYYTRTYYANAGPSQLADGWGTTLDASAYGGGFVRSSTRGNNNLKPERKTEIETGFDLRFLNDRIGLSASYYYNKTVDAILQVPAAATTGFQLTQANAAELDNRGVELQLNADIVKTDAFTWTFSPNWSTNKNRVLDLSGAESISLNGFTATTSRAVKGYQMGALWGTRLLRGDDGQMILDENGFPRLADTEGVIGDPNPAWRAGIGNTFNFKGLSLYVLFDFVHKVDVWNGTKGALYSYGTHGDVGVETTVPAAVADTLRLYGGNTVAKTYAPNADGGYTFRGNTQDFGAGTVALDERWYRSPGIGQGFTGPAELFVENVSYTRLREITLAYSLRAPGFRQKSRLQSIDFSITGRNLVLWTGYTGVDPETNLTGVSNGRGLDYFNNPSTKSFIFSIKINY